MWENTEGNWGSDGIADGLVTDSEALRGLQACVIED